MVVCCSPFPGDCGKAGGQGPRVYEPQALLGELFVLLGFFGVSALLFLHSFAAFELAKLFGQRCLSEVRASGPVKVQQHVW